MASSGKFALIYAPQTIQHLHVVERKYFSLISETIQEQLQFEPEVETKNRKPLKRPVEFGADWEIRFGPDNRFRVFYQVDNEIYEVHILAIGVKQNNRLFIGNTEVDI